MCVCVRVCVRVCAFAQSGCADRELIPCVTACLCVYVCLCVCAGRGGLVLCVSGGSGFAGRVLVTYDHGDTVPFRVGVGGC